jgi:hypothetical protein
VKTTHSYIYIFLVFLVFAACNFGETKKKHYYGSPAEHLKNKSYNDFYETEGRAPRKDEKKEIDVWADSINRVGGVINDDGYSTEFGTKETEKTVLDRYK